MATQFPNSVEEARALLMGMGQTSTGAIPSSAPVGFPSSTQAADILLQSMGQATAPARTVVTPLNPMEEAMVRGVNPVGNMPPTLAATKALLKGMGMTGIDDASSDLTTALAGTLTDLTGGSSLPTGLATPTAPEQTPVKADPLAADRNGWNLEKTGKVNTTGAEQRINARAAAERTGVTATKDANGRTVLSNVGNGTGPTGGPSIVKATTPNSLNDAVRQLRAATDPDTAAGIMVSVRQTAAAESARITSEAQTFAGNKLGVPALERYLTESEANDRASPSWFPGIGDSPGTAKIRQDLNQARAAADIEASRFLKTNTNAAALTATLQTAEAEIKRIERLADKKSTMEMNRESRAEDREARRVEEAEAAIGSLTPEMNARMVTLNPQLDYSSDPTQAMSRLYKEASKDKNRVEALKATTQQLPLLAMQGNPDATALVVAEEVKNNPSVTPQQIEDRLTRLRDKANRPGFDKDAIKQQYGTDVEGAKKALGDLNMASATDAAGKKQKRDMLFASALEMERREATPRFAGDTAAWGVQDPLFQAAQSVALKNTGRRDIKSVATAYLDGATGAAGIAKLQVFNQFINESVKRQGRSLFGVPDEAALKKVAYDAVRQDPAFLQSLMRPYGDGTAPRFDSFLDGFSGQALGGESAETLAARRLLAK